MNGPQGLTSAPQPRKYILKETNTNRNWTPYSTPVHTPTLHCIQMFRFVEIIEKLKVNITETKGYDLLLNVLGLGVPGTHFFDQVSEAIPLTACGGKYFFRSSGA